MENKSGKMKRAVILLWCISVSAFLYYFSASMGSEISVFQFINFTILLFGGGVAYHVTSELILCPETESNYKIWKYMLVKLAKVYVGYIISGLSLFFGVRFGGGFGWLFAFSGLVLGYIWVMRFLFELEKPIKELLDSSSNNKI